MSSSHLDDVEIIDCGGDIACRQRDDMEKVLVDNGITTPWCDLMQTLKMKMFFENELNKHTLV